MTAAEVARSALLQSMRMDGHIPRKEYPTMADNNIVLTERERAVAQEAARLAVQSALDEFYKTIGKNVVTKFFIIVGVAVVAFAMGKGWLKALL